MDPTKLPTLTISDQPNPSVVAVPARPQPQIVWAEPTQPAPSVMPLIPPRVTATSQPVGPSSGFVGDYVRNVLPTRQQLANFLWGGAQPIPQITQAAPHAPAPTTQPDKQIVGIEPGPPPEDEARRTRPYTLEDFINANRGLSYNQAKAVTSMLPAHPSIRDQLFAQAVQANGQIAADESAAAALNPDKDAAAKQKAAARKDMLMRQIEIAGGANQANAQLINQILSGGRE